MHGTLLMASGDEAFKLIFLVIFAIGYGLTKLLQKGQPETPEEELPRPPRRPSTIPPPIIIQREPSAQPPPRQRPSAEDPVQQVLRRMRVPPPQPVSRPTPPIVKAEPEPRRIVKLQREASELPSALSERTSREMEPTSFPAADNAPETTTSFARQPAYEAAQGAEATVSSRAQGYRSLLHSRHDVRRAIILREVLGPPLALRTDGPF